MSLQSTQSATADACCYRAACHDDAQVCSDCGRSLLRCAAFEQCGSLLAADGSCAVCIQPQLTLTSAPATARVGESVAFPLTITNASPVNRPLFLKGVWTRRSGDEWQPVDYSWDRLEAQQSNMLSIVAKLERAGVHYQEMLVALATRWRWREEVVGFTTGLAITVAQPQQIHVQQNIEQQTSDEALGGTVYAPIRITLANDREPDQQITQPLTLSRAPVYERQLGLRGTTDGSQVLRSANMTWTGFGENSTPDNGPINTRDGLLVLGRSRLKLFGGDCDVRMIAYQADGAVDHSLSKAISRHHFTIWIENNRLLLRVESNGGASLNGQLHQRGDTVELHDGMMFSPLPNQSDKSRIRVRFEREHDEIVAVDFISC